MRKANTEEPIVAFRGSAILLPSVYLIVLSGFHILLSPAVMIQYGNEYSYYTHELMPHEQNSFVLYELRAL